MARVAPSFSVSSLPSLAPGCCQKSEVVACLSPQYAVPRASTAEFEQRRLRSCSSSTPSTVISRQRSASSLLGQQLRIKAPPRLQPLRTMQVSALQSDLIRVAGVVVKTTRDALNAGAQLVPESVPRPIAQTGVALGGLVILSLVLRSIFSTILFIVTIGGIGYLTLLFLSRDSATSSSGAVDTKGSTGPSRQSDSEALEEARKIMEKYK